MAHLRQKQRQKTHVETSSGKRKGMFLGKQVRCSIRDGKKRDDVCCRSVKTKINNVQAKEKGQQGWCLEPIMWRRS